MNITCKQCGSSHALFWYQGTSERKLCYNCDKYPARRTKRSTGYVEIHHITKRLVYHEQTTANQLEGIPTVYSKPVLKKEADAHQEKFSI